jgi:hypothetical protein
MLLFAIHTNGYVPYLQSPTDYKLPLCSGDFDLLLDDAEVGSSNISLGNSSDVSTSQYRITNAQGVLIKEGTLAPGPQQLRLPETAGLYLLQISNPSTQIVERIIKL